MYRIMIYFNVLHLLIFIFPATLGNDTFVEINQGVLRGRFLITPANKTFRAFQGVPYAEPPLGPLRFQAPVLPKKWDGILNATKDPNVCYAIESDSPNESDDCLYLNVYTPVLSNEDKTKVPVLICFHGGGFSHGSSSYHNYGPDYLIEKEIIIVTVDYRLGPFGFLSTGDTMIPGNAGLKDQAAAINWTFQNIEAFGGDPSKITISGPSAGGASVGYQLLYKGNEGLFKGAILQSGSPLSIWSFLNSSSSRDYAFDLAKQINSSLDFSNNSSLLLDFLVNIDAKKIDEASTRTTISRPSPVIEVEHHNAFLTESQYKLLETGEFIRVPVLIGTNSEEEIHRASDLASLNKSLHSYENNPEKFIPKDFAVKSGIDSTLVGSSISDLYLQNVPEDEKMGHIVKFLSHTTFTTPMIKHADLASNYTDVYFYIFSYDGPMGNVNVTVKGADKIDHGEESRYLYKMLGESYSNDDLSKFPEGDILTHNRLIELWTNFVKYSNPTPGPSSLLQNVTWPKFTSHDNKFVDIGRNLEIKENPKSPYYKAWVQFYEDWAKKPFITF